MYAVKLYECTYLKNMIVYKFLFTYYRQRPYHAEYIGSRPITEIKQRRARLVLRWGTAWEHRVLLASNKLFEFFFSFFLIHNFFI